MSAGRDYEEDRLAELALYVAQRSMRDPRFGRTKLYKLLFFADFTAYRQLGASITGAVYQHLPQGPAPHQMLPAIRSLGAAAAAWQEEATVVGTQHRLVPLRAPRLDLFTGPEIALVDQIIDELRNLTNGQIADLSHDTMAWRLTEDGQEIPYGAALVSAAAPASDDLVWLEEVARSEGLGGAAR